MLSGMNPVFIMVVKAAIADLISPSPIPLGGPCLGEAFEHANWSV